MQGSRRALPAFEGVQYHFVECDLAGDLGDLPCDLGDLPGDLGDLPEGGAAAREAKVEATTGATETARQLQAFGLGLGLGLGLAKGGCGLGARG